MLRKQNLDCDRLLFIDRPAEFSQILGAELKKERRTVVIGGGDGTLSKSASQLIGADATLGILPAGTTNNFARSLNIPLDPNEALSIIAGGKQKRIGLGKISGGHYFSNLAAIGLSVQVAKEVSDQSKRALGRLAYPVEGLRWLFKHRAFRCRLMTPEKTYRFATHQLLVANGRYHGAAPITADASIFDDNLTIIAIGTDQSRWNHIKNLLYFARGKHESRKDTLVFQANSLRIETKPTKHIEADGEVVSKTPITITHIPQALRVFVP